MSSIAVISDIHGNLEALKSVLEDIKKRNIEKIICLGDIIAKGSNQKECLELIKENCQIVLRGNCDEFFSLDIDINKFNETEQKRIIWNHDKITDEDREYLLNLPFSHEMYISGRLVRFFHATPEKINGFVGNIDKIEKSYSLFLPSQNTESQNKADVVVYGHIHTAYLQRIYNRTIINTGSVGNAIDVIRNDEKDGNNNFTTLANYLIINGNLNSMNEKNPISFELVSIPYDNDKEIKSNIDNIEFDDYKTEITTGKYRDMEKINNSFKERGINIDEI